MSTTLVTLSFQVGVGYALGDYAQLHSNGGSGDIDWVDPVSDEHLDLFPGGAGIYGWGHAPWGHFRWGHAHAMRVPGWGYFPWGHAPWGHGAATVSTQVEVTGCGGITYAFACYDEAGNQHEGTPEEVTVGIHAAPDAPTGLKKSAYNKTTDILSLTAA